MKQYRIIISGGGTGGHIFPAISIANTFRKRFPEAEILFVGADDRMEMEKVPAAGYRIVGLPVSGFDRAHLANNIRVARPFAQKPQACQKDDTGVQTRYCRGGRRLCQRTDALDGCFLRNPYPDTGAEFLCRCHE